MQRGVFITFEGSEGCGKSTQIDRLCKRLREAGREVLVTREPGGTEVGEVVRHLLKFAPEGKNMVPEAELLLFTASRAQLVREVVRPAVERGVVVISDRFMDSTVVYQGVARQISAEAVKFINGFAVGTCVPDVTFILDMDSAEAMRRAHERREVDEPTDRMEQEEAEFYEAVRQGYLDLAERETDRCVIVPADRKRDDIERVIWERLNNSNHGILQIDSV